MTTRARLLILLLLIAGLLSFVSPTAGQEGIAATSVGRPVGLRRLAPGRWGIVEVEVRNESDEDRSLATEVFFKGNAEQRFARDVWVPARGVRTSAIPLHVPADIDPGDSLEIVGRADGGIAGSSAFRSLISLVRDQRPMAFVADPPGASLEQEAQGEDPAYEAVLAMRGALGLDRSLAILDHERLLPATFEGWNAVDQLVVTGDHLGEDSAAQVAVRQWLSAGGRIWLQLNQVTPEAARRLLGDAFRVEVVDRVPMTRFHVTGLGVDAGIPPAEMELEQPVELIRVFVDGAEILHRVDGWPASFAIPFGHGEVIVTTLGAHGWMRLRGANDPSEPDSLLHTKYLATDPMRSLADRMFNNLSPPALSASVQGAYLTERIGYRVPDRRLILLILLSFCGSIGIFGGILIRRQRLEHLAWLTILTALLSAGVVVGIGWASRQVVPPTVAQLQAVRIIPQTGDYVASGMIARFEPEQRPVSLESSHGWRIDPSMPDLTGQIRRLVWTDLNQWHWRGTSMAPGIWLTSTHSTARLPTPVQAAGRFGHEGFVGQLEAGPFTAPADALIATPFSPPLAANLRSDGRFFAAPTDLMAEGQFMDDALLSDEQRRRQALYAAWFAAQRESSHPQVPVLMAWAGPLDEQFQWPEDVQQTGATLLTVPLTIERTPPNVPVTIPSSMLDVRAVTGSRGRSGAFDNKTRSWISPNSRATATRLRFQLPAAVLPMTVRRATFTIDCNIPSRVVEVFAVNGETRELIARRSNPAGILSISIEDAGLLRLDNEGGLLLEIEVGELSTQVDEKTMANSGWTIRSTRLDVSGRTLPAAPHSAVSIQ